MRRSASFTLLALLTIGAASCMSPEGANADAPASAPASASASARAASAAGLDDAALRARALTLTPLAEGRTLVCDGARCLCREALRCGADGRGCPTLENNLAAFRQALARGPDGRRVDCRRAELGVCGPYRYFLFNGDIERRELRWFDAAGRLVAVRNRADYAAYCDGRTMTRLLGTLPDCAPMKRTELICGEAGPDGFSALDDALGRPATPR